MEPESLFSNGGEEMVPYWGKKKKKEIEPSPTK